MADNKLQEDSEENPLTLPQRIRKFADEIPHPEGLSILGMSKDLVHGFADLLEGTHTGQMSPEATQALLGLGTPGLLRGASRGTLASIPGFYSKTEKITGTGDFAQASPLLKGKMTGEQYLAEMKKAGVGQNELRDNPEILEKISAAGPGAKTPEEWSQILHPDGSNVWGTLASGMSERMFGEAGEPSRFKSWSTKDLPGASGYHEIAIDLPGSNLRQIYRSMDHYGNDALMHIRGQEFKLPDGKKAYLMDELQSDPIQMAREKAKEIGYKGDPLPKDWKVEQVTPNVYNNPHREFIIRDSDDGIIVGYGRTPEEAKETALQALERDRVPRPPLASNWTEFGVKRALYEAAKRGSDVFTWTTDAQQTARYNREFKYYDSVVTPAVEKIVKKLDPKAEKGMVEAKPSRELSGSQLSTRLDDHLSTLLGEDGGRLHVEFRNRMREMFPLNGNRTPRDATAEEILAGFPPDSALGRFVRGVYDKSPERQTLRVHSIPLSPELREKILSEGQSFYQGGFIAPTSQPETSNNNLQRQGEALRARPRLTPVPYNPFANPFIPMPKGT